MGITAKELAARLNLSATAVSMALNGKPGVSTETRAMVIREAEKAGYDFSRLSMKKNASGDIYCIICRAHNAILNYTPIFSELTDGIEQECRKNGYHLKTFQLYEKSMISRNISKNSAFPSVQVSSFWEPKFLLPYVMNSFSSPSLSFFWTLTLTLPTAAVYSSTTHREPTWPPATSSTAVAASRDTSALPTGSLTSANGHMVSPGSTRTRNVHCQIHHSRTLPLHRRSLL